jgi:hypothetical protein
LGEKSVVRVPDYVAVHFGELVVGGGDGGNDDSRVLGYGFQFYLPPFFQTLLGAARAQGFSSCPAHRLMRCWPRWGAGSGKRANLKPYLTYFTLCPAGPT